MSWLVLESQVLIKGFFGVSLDTLFKGLVQQLSLLFISQIYDVAYTLRRSKDGHCGYLLS